MRRTTATWLVFIACLAWPSIQNLECSVHAQTAASVDTDGDGLSDGDELTIYHTNPNRWDTDGDGQSDGAETRAGTDPNRADSVFKIVGPPAVSAFGWRISWTSIPGKTYRLQRLDQLSALPATWLDLSNVTASGPLATADDPTFSAAGRRFYRVLLVESLTGPVPTVTAIEASPVSATAAGIVMLTVSAQDTNGVAAVTFFDGSEILGAGSPIEGNGWRLLWPVDFGLNGTRSVTAQAINLTGGSAYSPQLSYAVNIAVPQSRQTLGAIEINADTFQTNGTSLVPTGNVRLGLVQLSSQSSISLAPSQNSLSGQGQVILPGLGVVFEGAFTIDPETGWLESSSDGVALHSLDALPVISLNSRTRLSPRRIGVNVVTGAMRGTGMVELTIPNDPASPGRFDGIFFFDPATFTVTVDGSFALGTVLGTGKTVVRLTDSTFVFTGNVTLPDGTVIQGALLKLAFQQATPRFTLAGEKLLSNGTTQSVSGNLTVSGAFQPASNLPPTPAVVRNDPDRFAPLGPDGQPIEGIALQANADGSLPPFEFRPGGRSLLGKGGQFYLRFPSGARVTEHDGKSFLQFTGVTAGFGETFPLQFSEPVERLSGAAAELPIGPVDLAQLAELVGRTPPTGLPITVFGKVHLSWIGGVISDEGIIGARFALTENSLPVPFDPTGFPDFRLDLSNSRGIQIPFFGEFTLPDAKGVSPTIKVTKNRPVWLGIRPDGKLTLSGRGEVTFPNNGPKFAAEFQLDDPFYEFRFSASGLHLPLLQNLGPLLPNPACLSDATPETAEALTGAAQCLSAADKAFFNFSAEAAGFVADDQTAVSPPQVFSGATALLEAWSYSALNSAGLTLPNALFKSMLTQAGDSAASARELETVAAYRLALERLRKAGLRTGNEAEFDAALTKAIEAAVRRAQDPDAISSLASLKSSLRALLETEQLLQSSGTRVSDARLQAAMASLMNRFTASYAQSLGVRAGVFAPEQNAVINGMNRFVVYESLANWLEVLENAQKLGIDGNLQGPISETFVQLGIRLQRLLTDTLAAAETQNDYAAFSYALEDYLDLIAYRQAQVFPTNPALPQLFSPAQLAARLGAVFQAATAQPGGERSLVNQSAEIRRLVHILRQMPAGVTFAADPFQRAYARLDDAIGRSMIIVRSASANLRGAVELLEAGILEARLRDQFQFQSTTPWETNERLGNVVDQIALKAQAQKGWSELHQAIGLLLAEADRQGSINNLARRKIYLLQAAKLTAAARQVAVGLLQATPAGQLADMLLPGDLQIDRVAGAIRYDRLHRTLNGAFSGQMRLPKFDLSLTLQNASFSTGGEFDLNAFGRLAIPSAANPVARLSITERRPLHIQFRAPNDIKFAGSGRLEVNGMTVEAFIGLEDPVYRFGVAFEGLRFDLAKSLTVYIPTIPDTQPFQAETAAALKDYFQSMNGALEPLAGLTDAPKLGEVGEPPDFQAPVLSIPTQPLEAWANQKLLDARNNLNRDFSATTNSMRLQLQALASLLATTQAELLAQEDFLRITIASRKLAQAFQARPDAALDPNSDPELKQLLDQQKAQVKNLLTNSHINLTPSRIHSILEAAGNVSFAEQSFGRDGTDVDALLPQFFERASGSLQASAGLNAATGQPQNPAAFNQLKEEDLNQRMKELLQLQQQAQLSGVQVSYRQPLQTLAMRRRELALAELNSLAETNVHNFKRIGALTDDLLEVQQAAQGGLFDYPATPVLQPDGTFAVTTPDQDLSQNITAKQNAAINYVVHGYDQIGAAIFDGVNPKDLFGREYRAKAKQIVQTRQPAPPGWLALLNKTMTDEWNDLKTEIEQPWTADRIHDGAALLGRLVDLAAWAQYQQLPELEPMRVALGTLTLKFTAVAEAQKAWWLLDRYSELLLAAAQEKINNTASALQDSIQTQAMATLRATARLTSALALLAPQAKAADLALPGDLVVRRAFGEVEYHRDTGELSGRFGGASRVPGH